MKDLRRFQEEKENDLRRYMVGSTTLLLHDLVNTDVVADGIRAMPPRLGETQQSSLGRSKSRGQ